MHARITSALTAAAVLTLTGCDTPSETVAPDFGHQAGATGSANGGGHFDAGVDVTFAFGIVQFNGFDAVGNLTFQTALGGEAIEFHGRATCLAIDAENNRAWVGGIVTSNNSTHPGFTTPVHQVGKDIWFRVVDYGEGSDAAQVDRTTFVGFEGSAGIITSQEYCETRPWPGPPDDVADARTGPVTEGNIQVRSRG